MPKDWDTLQVRSALKAKLHRIYGHDQRKPENQKFNAYFDNLLQDLIEYREMLSKYGPFIEYRGNDEYRIFLFDSRLQQPVDILVDKEKKRLTCQSCKGTTDNCVHIGFCYAVPEVYVMLVKSGFRKESKPVTAFKMAAAVLPLVLIFFISWHLDNIYLLDLLQYFHVH